MATRETVTREIATERDLAALFEDLQHSRLGSVEISVPEDASVLRNGENFQDLADAARDAGAQVSVVTSDPIRQQYARIFGLSEAGREASVRQTTRVGLHSATEETRQTRRDPGIEMHSRPPSGQSRASTEMSAFREALFDDDASYSFVVSPPKPRLPVDGTISPSVVPARRRKRANSRARFLLTVTTASVVVGIVLLLVGILAPWMNVSVIPSTGTASFDVTYGVAGTDVPVDVAVQPREVSASARFEETIPTTGERSVPDGVASGTVTITNASTSEQLIEAGTQLFTAVESVVVVLDEDVFVPAADPFGSMTFGSATVGVSADIAGPDGNLAAGEVSGQISETLFYNNHSELNGGTMRTIAVVSESDIETLRSAAQVHLEPEIDSAIRADVQGEGELIDGSIERSDITFDFSHEPGTDAESVSVTATISATAMVFDSSELHEAGAKAAVDGLPGEVENSHILLSDQIELGDPEPISGGAYPAYRITAEGSTQAVIEQSELDRLETELVGADGESARQLLNQVEGVERFDIVRGPDWLPAKLPPRLTSRIAVEIETVASTEEQASATR